MNDMNEITLPWPPTVNTYYRNTPGKTLISAKGREYRNAVYGLVMEQRIKSHSGRLGVHVAAYPPDKRLRDLDNLFKAVLDSLTKAGVWHDDGQIDVLTICRMGIGGMVKVRIEALAS